ncbi:TWiK family of potassium channels protein 7-like [Hydractinia symbiolongicarpus]|uniref:TWiK family of potassium channels protein 7-like n=1 Tax=Hydractinia symbiolongicarpus TaxID=13093 RepID=UPI00254FE16F|nr:TWiK family of potassium channels protein 7-like [Hydractinia symbiolongicarpus]
MASVDRKFISRQKIPQQNQFSYIYDKTYKQTAFVKREAERFRVEKIISEVQNYKSESRKELLKSLKKQALKLLCYFIIFLVYILLGAVIFFYIEECSGADIADDKVRSKADTAKFFKNTCQILYDDEYKLINISSGASLNKNESTKTSSAEHNNTFMMACIKIMQNSSNVIKETKLMTSCDVTTTKSLKYITFAMFTILSIGYGNTTPITTIGRGVLILYAIFGIPIAVTMYRFTAKLLVQLLTLLIRCIDKKIHGRQKADDRYLHLKVLMISLVFMLVFVAFCCSLTMREGTEKWTFASSFYFWFVSLTLIGYGDLTFSQKTQLENPPYLVFSFLNILFGLALSATIIEAYAMTLRKGGNSIITQEKNEIENKEELDADVGHILLQLGIFSIDKVEAERYISTAHDVQLIDKIEELSV